MLTQTPNVESPNLTHNTCSPHHAPQTATTHHPLNTMRRQQYVPVVQNCATAVVYPVPAETDQRRPEPFGRVGASDNAYKPCIEACVYTFHCY